jgi:hypothetical protein
MRTRFSASVTGALGLAALLAPSLDGVGAAQTREIGREYSLGQVFMTNADTLTDGSEKNLFDALFTNVREVNCIPSKPKVRILTGPNPDATRLDRLEAGRKEQIARIVRDAGFTDTEGFLTVEFDRTGRPDGGVMVIYELVKDEKPPLVTVNPIHQRVRAGEQVPITIEARDDSPPADRGIQWIELRNLTDGGTRVGDDNYGNYGREVDRCNASTLQRTVVVRYTVPRRPPPIIQLEALAQDKAANRNGAVAVLMTGEFSGHFEWSHKTTAADGSTEEGSGDYVFSFDTDREGVVTGRIVGWNDVRFDGSNCPTVRLSRGSLAGNLAGSYTGGTFSISMETSDRDEDYPKVQYCGLGAPAGPHRVLAGFVLFQDAFLRLRPQPDGSLQSRKVAGASPGSCTLTLWPRK